MTRPKLRFRLITNFSDREVTVPADADPKTKYPFMLMRVGDLMEVTGDPGELVKCRNQVHSYGYDRRQKYRTRMLDGRLMISRII